MALALHTQTAVIAVSRASCLNMANITLPSLLTEALSLEAVPVSRAVGNHLATLCGTVDTSPTAVTHALQTIALAMTSARWSSGAEGKGAVHTSACGAEALAANADTIARAVVGAHDILAVWPGEWLGADVRPQSRAVVGSIQRIADALPVNTETVAVAVVLAIQQFTVISVEALVADACPVSTHTVVGASHEALFQGAIITTPSLVAFASEVGAALAMVGAVVRALTGGAVVAAETGVASADAIITPSRARAVIGAAHQGTLETSPTREAVAGAVIAVSVLVAVALARLK